MRRGLKRNSGHPPPIPKNLAARAAPYEKGTETGGSFAFCQKPEVAARAAPYEKGTETRMYSAERYAHALAARAAPYEKGTETQS